MSVKIFVIFDVCDRTISFHMNTFSNLALRSTLVLGPHELLQDERAVLGYLWDVAPAWGKAQPCKDIHPPLDLCQDNWLRTQILSLQWVEARGLPEGSTGLRSLPCGHIRTAENQVQEGKISSRDKLCQQPLLRGSPRMGQRS